MSESKMSKSPIIQMKFDDFIESNFERKQFDTKGWLKEHKQYQLETKSKFSHMRQQQETLRNNMVLMIEETKQLKEENERIEQDISLRETQVVRLKQWIRSTQYKLNKIKTEKYEMQKENRKLIENIKLLDQNCKKIQTEIKVIQNEAVRSIKDTKQKMKLWCEQLLREGQMKYEMDKRKLENDDYKMKLICEILDSSDEFSLDLLLQQKLSIHDWNQHSIH
ncbi:hypothetical protein BLOT_014311 [Blomia tropicalis]|nr:hypothetical protein BLOT_014311 [Blomia tropicalis]